AIHDDGRRAAVRALDIDERRRDGAEDGKDQSDRRERVQQVDERIDGGVDDADTVDPKGRGGFVDNAHLLEGVAELPGAAAAGDRAGAGAAGVEVDLARILVDDVVHVDIAAADGQGADRGIDDAVDADILGREDLAARIDDQLRRQPGQ